MTKRPYKSSRPRKGNPNKRYFVSLPFYLSNEADQVLFKRLTAYAQNDFGAPMSIVIKGMLREHLNGVRK